MKIGLLLSSGPLEIVSDTLIASALADSLRTSETRWLVRAELRDNFDRLSELDLILLLGTAADLSNASDEWLLRLCEIDDRVPVVPLGLHIDTLDRAPVRALVERFATKSIATVDPNSADTINRALGREVAFAAASPLLWLHAPQLPRHAPTIVYSPNDDKAGFGRRLARHRRTLFLADRAEDLQFAEGPGPATLFSPRTPMAHLAAINAASAFVSDRPELIEFAVARGVPAYAISGHSPTALGVPQIDEREWDDTPDYPWLDVLLHLEVRRRELERFLLALGISRRAPQKTPPQDFLNVACICDQNYLPHFAGLYDNLVRLHGPNVFFHLLVLDRATEQVIRTDFRDALLGFYELEDLWSADELKLLNGRDLGSRAVASKARLLKRALATSPGPVLYVDCDLYFESSPLPLLAPLREKPVLLFTQYNDAIENNLRYGAYNTGLVGVNHGAESFLDWWTELCLYRCANNPERGYFIDQAYFDLAPTHFGNLEIAFRPEHNLGHWAHRALGVTFDESYPFRARLYNGATVESFHCSQPDERGAFEIKSAWDQVATYFRNLPDSAAASRFYTHVICQQKNYWPKLARVYSAIASLQNRIFKRTINISPTVVEWLWSRSGDEVLKGAMEVFRLLRAVKRNWERRPPPDAAADAWIRLQRERIDGTRESLLSVKRQIRKLRKKDAEPIGVANLACPPERQSPGSSLESEPQ